MNDRFKDERKQYLRRASCETNELPPDPDGLNDNRACWADAALETFRSETGTDLGDAVADLLSDLMHWCDRNGQDFNTELERARGHYSAETTDNSATDECDCSDRSWYGDHHDSACPLAGRPRPE